MLTQKATSSRKDMGTKQEHETASCGLENPWQPKVPDLDHTRPLQQLDVHIVWAHRLGAPVVPVYPFVGEGSPTKIDYRKKGTLC